MLASLSVLLLLAASATTGFAQKPSFTVGWSIYAGWTPYYYMNKAGILKVGGQVRHHHQGATLRLRAIARRLRREEHRRLHHDQHGGARHARRLGRADHRILIGDYSNGNDALLVRNGLQMKDLAGKKMLLVQKTVSEYLFDRAMTLNGLRDQIKHVRLINTSDSDIATAFISDTSAAAVVTWKPMVSQLLKQKGVTSLFNSSQIPGEILDLTVVRTDVLDRPRSGQKFAKALAGRVVRNARD